MNVLILEVFRMCEFFTM